MVAVTTDFWWRQDEPWWAELYLWPLTLLSLLYAAGAALARSVARPVRAQVPVISVGNLTVGGAGKTPVVLALAERLLARGFRPAVLSRGYGRRSRAPWVEVDVHSSAVTCGDEPLLLKRRLPRLIVLVGARRALLAAEAVRQGADVILLDDGLQHHALARDLDVVVVDASNPRGNGRLLPRGPLREGSLEPGRIERGLLWYTRCDLAAGPRLLPSRLLGPVESAFESGSPSGPEIGPDPRAAFAGKRVFLLAGLARPASFEATVRGLGAVIAGARWFGDHHPFSSDELAQVCHAAALASAELIATTEKDFVRILDWSSPLPLVPVPVSLRISSGEEALEGALDAVLAAALGTVLE